MPMNDKVKPALLATSKRIMANKSNSPFTLKGIVIVLHRKFNYLNILCKNLFNCVSLITVISN